MKKMGLIFLFFLFCNILVNSGNVKVLWLLCNSNKVKIVRLNFRGS